jgi:hypothetical protein
MRDSTRGSSAPAARQSPRGEIRGCRTHGHGRVFSNARTIDCASANTTPEPLLAATPAAPAGTSARAVGTVDRRSGR